jgi:hypothetical protein
VTRILLAVPALLLFLGGASHLAAFSRVSAAVAASDLPPFFGNSLKALWVMDSCGMFAVAAVCVALAARPRAAAAVVIALLSLIPLSTAALLYIFIGASFQAAHLLAVAGLSMTAAAISAR